MLIIPLPPPPLLPPPLLLPIPVVLIGGGGVGAAAAFLWLARKLSSSRIAVSGKPFYPRRQR
jgi:hypothetical protein